MRGRTAHLGVACLLCGLLLAGCGRSAIPPEAVVRAWSEAVNSGEDERAAQLFSPGAIAIRDTQQARLRDVDAAVRWNEALRCGGLVQRIATHGRIVTATFQLTDRAGATCSARGGSATYEFEVRHNRIARLQLLSATSAPPAAPTTTTVSRT